MKTYAESEGQKTFDWNKALNKEEITLDEWIDMEELASSWVTCACGNLCDVIPREPETGNPLDLELKRLGVGFYNHIIRRDIDEAKITLESIEKRSAELIKEIQDEQKEY